MSFINDFPRSNEFEYQLDQIIEMYKELNYLPNSFNELNSNFENLKTFITNYFDTLDLSEETREALDKMASDGTLATIITPLVQSISNPVIVSSISQMTDKNRIYLLTTDSFLYFWNGTAWTSSGIIYGNVDDSRQYIFRGEVSTLGYTDFNNIITNGFYQITTNSAQTLENSPYNGGGYLDVEHFTGNFCLQRFYSTTGVKKYRTRNSNTTWNNWVIQYERLEIISGNIVDFRESGAYQIRTANLPNIESLPQQVTQGGILLANRLSGTISQYFYIENNTFKIWLGWFSSNKLTWKLVCAPNQNIVENFVGKTIALIGDSETTQLVSNVPEITIEDGDVGKELSAYLTARDVTEELTINGITFPASDIGNLVTFTPTSNDVGKSIGKPINYNPATITPWWTYVQSEFGCSIRNVSWSGASISTNRSSSNSYKASAASHPATVHKAGDRIIGTTDRIAPDAIIIARGINDLSHEVYVKTNPDYFNSADWNYPTSDTVDGELYIENSIAYTVSVLRASYSNTPIYICTLPTFRRVNYNTFTSNNGFANIPMFNDAIRRCAHYLNLRLIDFAEYANMNMSNIGMYTSDGTHFNNYGHEILGKLAIKIIAQSV